ncbi:hypothetical protein R2R35_22915 [Anaerocolumna sp. AGMB13020]|uniref:hypothetical protein n=1 Tax=Anaerocolumna sp. AGMB13020 TaxID=3081750 RepID=UPI002952E4D7|nr:hypothetical protein [Anaerocolumna sp. AGMB13020]WOO36609.1 hypothetical protein R2R35_22915 [Anaerocolumna sp. AGMB13020]
MKKKFMVILVAVLLVFSNFNISTVSAATCSAHSNYKDQVSGISNWSTTHQVFTGLYVDGKPIYSICNITNVAISHSVRCGVCNTEVGNYTEYQYYHSSCGK